MLHVARRLLEATVIPSNASTHLSSGRKTVWRDSLFRLRQGREGGVEEIRWVHNFWTTASFTPTETYHFTVTGLEGRMSTVTITLPDTLSAIEISPPGAFSPEWEIFVHGADWLADVVVILHERFPSGRREINTFSVVADTSSSTSGAFTIRFPSSEVTDRIFGELIRREVRITAAGPDWPRAGRFDEDVLIEPGAVSNVENGYGYLGGVVSRTVPLRWPPPGAGNASIVHPTLSTR